MDPERRVVLYLDEDVTTKLAEELRGQIRWLSEFAEE
jgi:hypothetical protein